MSGNINEFKSSFKTDLARPNRFDVSIPIPYVLIPYLSDAKNLSMRCEHADIPGRTFMTTERKIGSTPNQKFPYQTAYNEMTLTFIVGDDMKEKIFFDAWQELINPSQTYNFKYKNDYVVDISINQYNVSNELTYTAALLDAFPVSVSQMDLDWSSDGYHKLSVTFAFTQWRNNSVQALGQSFVNQALSGLSDTINGAL